MLLEGGPTLAAAFLRAGLVDQIVAYVAPALLGAGVAALGRHRASARIGDGVRLEVDRRHAASAPTSGSPARPVRAAAEDELMFTGIVEELGTVVAARPLGDSARLTIRGPASPRTPRHGDSIAVNGVCLTVVESTAPTRSPPT